MKVIFQLPSILTVSLYLYDTILGDFKTILSSIWWEFDTGMHYCALKTSFRLSFLYSLWPAHFLPLPLLLKILGLNAISLHASEKSSHTVLQALLGEPHFDSRVGFEVHTDQTEEEERTASLHLCFAKDLLRNIYNGSRSSCYAMCGRTPFFPPRDGCSDTSFPSRMEKKVKNSATTEEEAFSSGHRRNVKLFTAAGIHPPGQTLLEGRSHWLFRLYFFPSN